MSSEQLSLVRNNLNTILEYIFINLQFFIIMLRYQANVLFKFVLENDLGLTSKFQ